MDDQPRQAVRMVVAREATAWDRQDVEAQLDLFHPDVVWTHPPTGYDHDPATWELGFGRSDRDRWREEWQTLFDAFELVHNRWDVVRVDTSEAGDGGLAVVDVEPSGGTATPARRTTGRAGRRRSTRSSAATGS